MESSGPPNDIKIQPAVWHAQMYYVVPAILSILQLIYIAASNTNIRQEELAESVRNVFWLDQRLIYDGVSSNVGYYGLLLIVYKIFGFSIYAAKYVRLVIYAAAMCSLAALLQKFMHKIPATIILVTVGLSPTLLFFNTIQTSFGMDILYGIICLHITLHLQFDGSPKDLTLAFVLGFIAMIAAMSYPTFLFYLPSLAFINIYLWWPRRQEQKATQQLVTSAVSSTAGFIVPFLIAIFYLKDAREFLNDPVTHAGLFRGGGKFQADIQILQNSLQQTFSDLFQKGTSFYYYVQQPDFSGFLTWIAVVVIFALGVYIAVTTPSWRPIFLLTGFHISLNLIVPGFSSSPGIRRSTGFLAGIYVWYAIILCGLFTQFSLRKIKQAGVAICLFFSANNLISYVTNIKTVSLLVPYSEAAWFAVEDTPQKSLQYWVGATASGEPLTCYEVATKTRVECQYGKIYAAIAGFRRWNGLREIPVMAYDWKTQENIILTPDLWETYYFRH
jgi:hypothetical protein